MTLFRIFALMAACAELVASPASARGRRHHRGHHGAAPAHASRQEGVRYGYPQYYGGYDAQTQGGAVARATARAQTEPGVTEELAPDARQTATGGPSGGIPGFSGGM